VDGLFKRMGAAHAAEPSDFALFGEAIPPLSKAEKQLAYLTGQTCQLCIFGVISLD